MLLFGFWSIFFKMFNFFLIKIGKIDERVGALLKLDRFVIR